MQNSKEISAQQNKDDSTRHKFIWYQGKQILYVDFSNLNKPSEKDMGIQYVLQAKSVIAQQTANSLLMLTNVKNSSFDTEVATVMKEYAAHNRKYVKRSAIIGIKGLQIPLFNALNKLAGRNMRSFRDEQEAKDWLIKD